MASESNLKKEIAVQFVRDVYSSFGVAMLEEMLAYGREFADTEVEEVLCMNAALAEEIECRKRQRDGATMHEPSPRIECPRCHAASYNPNDIEEGYCGQCHEFTSPRAKRRGL